MERPSSILPLWSLQILSGRKTYLLRSQFLLGGSSGTDYLQRRIYSDEELFLMKHNFVSMGVDLLNLELIFFYCVISSVMFGTWFVNGWVSTLRIPHHWWITSSVWYINRFCKGTMCFYVFNLVCYFMGYLEGNEW